MLALNSSSKRKGSNNKINNDNLTKFIWVKNYTKTYKNKANINYDTRKIRVYTREDCTAKIHEEWVKNPPKNSSQSRDGYISPPAHSSASHVWRISRNPPSCTLNKMVINTSTQWVIVHRNEKESNQWADK
jgi:hypothetical protein